jgi:hypothetical protein
MSTGVSPEGKEIMDANRDKGVRFSPLILETNA